MSQVLLDRLLAGTLPDPDGSGTLSTPLRTVVLGRNLASGAADLLAPLDLGRALCVVMDPDTRLAIGEDIAQALDSRFTVTSFVLAQHPHPDMDAVALVRAGTEGADALVAVGSGSINDIVKYAAHLDRKPYVVFGTAPSMNGYTSIAAAITDKGLKKSLQATLPRGVFMARAPSRLIAAGFGDAMARATAQTDWLMSHLVLGTPYRKAPFELLHEDEAAMILNASAVQKGDVGAVELLTRSLVMSGFGMTICGGSYPASQGEHLIAHYIDMLGEGLPLAYHGEHIAITTLTMARMQERLLSQTSLQLTAVPETSADFTSRLGEDLGASCWTAYAPKNFDSAARDRINANLRDWPDIRKQLRAAGRPSADIEAALLAVRAPTKPEDAGIPRAFYREAVVNARLIRDRFTSLDLAHGVGDNAAFEA
jgi:glycerol-1-phosphate dehydrogenase [NAD(P)+]